MSVRITSDFIEKATGASLLQKGGDSFSGVSTDSRHSCQDKIFLALKGENFDAHDFLKEAFRQGASGFLVSDKNKAEEFLSDKSLFKNKKVSVFLVPDSLKALQDLARAWRKLLDIQVVAITGSNGKTSTCSFLKTLLSSKKPFASPRSYNNAIGVPLSLLSVNRPKAFLIQEIGTSAPGEVEFLTSLCDPLLVAVTMVGPSHLEGLKSLEGVMREKEQIYLKSGEAKWVFNLDNEWTRRMYENLSPSHKGNLTFSHEDKKADVCLQFESEESQSSVIQGHIGSFSLKTPVSFSGSSQLENLMCAATLALGAGIAPQKIASQIIYCEAVSWRQEWVKLRELDISVLFDAYNANPSSMRFFLEACEKFSEPNKRLLVLGDMKELGEETVRYHKEMASHPAILKARFVAFVGLHAGLVEEELKRRGFQGFFLGAPAYNKEILSAVKKAGRAGDFLGLKASRSLKLERLLKDLD